MDEAVPKDPRPLSIFIVENDPDTLKYLKIYLQEIGHEVQSASSMKEALETMPKADFDVLISDLGLPDGDGWELMKRAEKVPSVFAIAMSGYWTAADRARSMKAGFRHHLRKPFTPAELDPLLREAMQETAAAQK